MGGPVSRLSRLLHFPVSVYPYTNTTCLNFYSFRINGYIWKGESLKHVSLPQEYFGYALPLFLHINFRLACEGPEKVLLAI